MMSCHIHHRSGLADDIALISEEIQQAQTLLQRVEEASASVGLAMNAKD